MTRDLENVGGGGGMGKRFYVILKALK